MNVRPAYILDSSDPVSKAISEITRTGLAVVVVKDRKYCGLISDRDIRRSGTDLSKEKCGSIAVKAPVLSSNSSLLDITNAFFAGRWKSLPVIDGTKITGMVSRSDLLEVLLEEKLLSKKRVDEVMSHPVVSIASDASISQAKEIMRKTNVRRLIVSDDGNFKGILSTFDIADEMYRGGAQGKDSLIGDKVKLDKTSVESYMRPEVETISPDAPLAEAAKKMVENDISALVVLEGKKTIGIITARDLFETAITAEDESPVYISGLEPSDKDLYPEIFEYCKDTINKLAKGFDVQSLSVHVKKHGERKYSLRARLQGARNLVTVSSVGWSMAAALKAMRDELKKVVAKKKFNKMHQE